MPWQSDETEHVCSFLHGNITNTWPADVNTPNLMHTYQSYHTRITSSVLMKLMTENLILDIVKRLIYSLKLLQDATFKRKNFRLT